MNNIIGNVKDKVFGTGRNFYLAGLGVAATVEGNTRNTYEMLVEKGRDKTANRGPSTASKTKDAVSGRVKDLSDKVSGVVHNGVTNTLGRLGIPSRDEIQALTVSVEQLTNKVDALGTKEVA